MCKNIRMLVPGLFRRPLSRSLMENVKWWRKRTSIVRLLCAASPNIRLWNALAQVFRIDWIIQWNNKNNKKCCFRRFFFLFSNSFNAINTSIDINWIIENPGISGNETLLQCSTKCRTNASGFNQKNYKDLSLSKNHNIINDYALLFTFVEQSLL